MYKDKKHNKLIEKLLVNGTIYVPQKDYEIIDIQEHDTYYQIWYKHKIKLYSMSDETGTDVGWVKVPFKNINQHLRKEKIKRIIGNVNNR